MGKNSVPSTVLTALLILPYLLLKTTIWEQKNDPRSSPKAPSFPADVPTLGFLASFSRARPRRPTLSVRASRLVCRPPGCSRDGPRVPTCPRRKPGAKQRPTEKTFTNEGGSGKVCSPSFLPQRAFREAGAAAASGKRDPRGSVSGRAE